MRWIIVRHRTEVEYSSYIKSWNFSYVLIYMFRIPIFILKGNKWKKLYLKVLWNILYYVICQKLWCLFLYVYINRLNARWKRVSEKYQKVKVQIYFWVMYLCIFYWDIRFINFLKAYYTNIYQYNIFFLWNIFLFVFNYSVLCNKN